MTNIIEYNKSQVTVKTDRDLPKHLTFDEYKDIYYSLSGQDQLLCGLLWNTGGRISDVLSLTWKDIDFNRKVINLFVDKRDITIKIPIDDLLINDFKNIITYTKPDITSYIFPSNSGSGHMTRQGAFKKIKTHWSSVINRPITPHMFRHGLAIYLLAQGVNIKVIAARLGHANVFTTMDYYLVVTPEIQREMMKDIPMR